uniref:Calponin-homology (CH) domain-containing protein n=1 Tax=Sphenodon punctatus TaxID=8508 RepID=A0A8D0H8L4_SPHPU
MPAILVASKMKSGLPKPVHSAAPILHVPAARTIPQPCYLKFGNNVEVTKSSYSSQIPLKSPTGHESAGDGVPKKNSSIENGFDTQIYTDWANHYLAKSGHKRLIKDLQQDVTDGVLLAEIIQVVAKACLSFMGKWGKEIENVRNYDNSAILGLFFSLSRYKQQQQQPQKQHPQHHPSQQPPIVCQQTGPSSQCQVGVQQQQQQQQPQLPASPHTQCQQPQQAAHHQSKAQPEMQSRWGVFSKLLFVLRHFKTKNSFLVSV